MIDESTTRAVELLGILFAAFCVWLGVRIYNRREARAKRLAVGLVVLIVTYLLSIGPVLWLGNRDYLPSGMETVIYQFYSPILLIVSKSPEPVASAVLWWINLGMRA